MYTEKKMLLNQKHLSFIISYIYIASICYRISNIFIGLVVYFYELIVYMLLERNAFDSIAFSSHCKVYFDLL